MEGDRLKIFVHRLGEGRKEVISETLGPELMDLSEAELRFQDPVCVSGEAEVVDGEFCLSIRAATRVQMPCRVCGEWVTVELKTPELMHNQSLNELRSGVFQMQGMIREGLLLELPHCVECSFGVCPERKEINRYLSQGE